MKRQRVRRKMHRRRKRQGKANEGSKKREESSFKNKYVSQKQGEGSAKQKEEDRDPDARRNVDRDQAGSVSKSSADRRRTSHRRALPKSTPRCESPPHTISGWEWREFLDFGRRTSASRPTFKRYKK